MGKPVKKSRKTKKSKVNVYIDGFNLYHAIDDFDDNKLKWLNLQELAKTYIKPGEVLNKVLYFTAILTWEKVKQDRHKNYIAAMKAYGVEVITSKFRRVSKHCRVMDRFCKRHEEKQTDVAFAISVFSGAMLNEFNRAILITADSDHVPLVKAVREHFPKVILTLAAPPSRSGEARELGDVVHDRKPITIERIRACGLPRDVYANGRKVATRPALYG